VPRPTVEPERFASLRPPTYNGAMTNERASANARAPFTQFTGIGGLGIGGIGGLGALGAGGLPAGGNSAGFGGGVTGFGGQFGFQGLNRYQGAMARNQVGAPAGAMEAEEDPSVIPTAAANRRLTYEQWQERFKERKGERQKDVDEAKRVGAQIASLDPHQSIASVAAAEEIGHAFRYVIEEKVSLPRQKSALLPLLDKEVAATRLSIFNQAVHDQFPLLGLRFKNTTGQPLTQGPVTVFEDGSYAGDARLPDLEPGEERLMSYAVDLGTEVKAEEKLAPSPKMTVRTSDGALQVGFTMRSTRTYCVRNRSKHARTLVIEHPVRSNWRLDDVMKPREQSRDLYRFDVPVKPGETVKFEVHELQGRVDPFQQQWAKTPAPDIAETHFGTNLLLDMDQAVRTLPPELLGAKLIKGELLVTSKQSHTRTYRVLNRSRDERREVTVEHQTPAEWRFVGAAKPVEGSQSLYRFPLTVEPNRAATHTVTEERTDTAAVKVAALNGDAIAWYLAHAAVPLKVKDALKKLSEQKAALTATQRHVEEILAQLKEISDDQARLRLNLDRVPSRSDAYQRYVKKFDDQETQIESLREKLKQKQAAAKAQQDALEESFKGLTAE